MNALASPMFGMLSDFGFGSGRVGKGQARVGKGRQGSARVRLGRQGVPLASAKFPNKVVSWDLFLGVPRTSAKFRTACLR